jgi:hypothetical protein
MASLTLTREFYIPKNAELIKDEQSDAVVYVHDNGKPTAMGFAGRAQKPLFHHCYRSGEERERAVLRFFQTRREHTARKIQQREERKAFTHGCQVGDILVSTWGYDQTNVDFYEIVALKRKQVVLCRIHAKAKETGRDYGICVPLPGAYVGEPFRRLATRYGVGIDKVRTARLWNTRRVAGVPVGDPIVWTSGR